MTLATDIRGSGRPLILLPWFSLDHTAMMAAFEPLDLDGFQRIYVDLPGVGSSPAGPDTSDDIVDMLGELVGRHPSAVLGGCSYGGYLAAGVARRFPVAALLLICHGTRIKFEERDLAGTGSELPDGPWLDGVPPDLRSHLRNALGEPDADVAARVAAVVAAADTGDADYLTRLRSTGYQLSDEEAEVRFDGPACIIAGRNDHIGGFNDQFRSLRNLPNATFTVVAGAGHYVALERPEIFARLVQGWLTTLEHPPKPS